MAPVAVILGAWQLAFMNRPASHELTTGLKQQARELGFQLAGVCQAGNPLRLAEFHRWLSAGYAGSMHYLAERAEAYKHPSHVLDGVQSILMLGMNYSDSAPSRASPGSGQVARYAWGESDYHDVLHDRLKRLKAWLIEQVPAALVRGIVDTAPLLERDFAQQAGLGWIGKNTMLISREEGSWFFLAALLTDQSLVSDEPFQADHCGTCRACLDACPTDAFPSAYVLDAQSCISYLTIELREEIPTALREPMGSWVFGCDICQQVCPWNQPTGRVGVRQAEEPAFSANSDLDPLELTRLFAMTDDQFRERFRRTPLWRSRRRGLLRNAAIVLGNQQHQAALEALTQGLHDEEVLVRGASAWALGRLGSPLARRALEQRRSLEAEPIVASEIESALDMPAASQDGPGVTSA